MRLCAKSPKNAKIVRQPRTRYPARRRALNRAAETTGKGMFDLNDRIRGYDDELAAAIEAERVRQEEHIELIASENYASPRVLAAQG